MMTEDERALISELAALAVAWIEIDLEKAAIARERAAIAIFRANLTFATVEAAIIATPFLALATTYGGPPRAP